MTTLKDVKSNIPAPFESWFPFEKFNKVQSESLDALLNSSDSVVITAPTGAGKTVLGLLGFIKFLSERSDPSHKALYLAPMKALTYEKTDEWSQLQGITAEVLTGESPSTMERLSNADVIISTPEKWDSVSRKWSSPQYEFVNQTRLIVIDEVHLLDAEGRGDALEALVSRMKYICPQIRFIAMSATLPNYHLIAQWLNVPSSNQLVFGDSYRPSVLHKKIVDYFEEGRYTDRLRRSNTVNELIEPFLEEKQPVLIFVSSRADTINCAKSILSHWDDEGKFGYFRTPETIELSKKVRNTSLKDVIFAGIAFHHAGLPKEDRAIVEEAFRRHQVKVLVSTSTLAWGVNLPARSTVIRDIYMRDPLKGRVEVSPIDIIQMLGRAGRPGYDSEGYGFVIVPSYKRKSYSKIISQDGVPVSSRLRSFLGEHINAEVCCGHIKSLSDAVNWIRSTFYGTWIAQKEPDPQRYNRRIEYVTQTVISTLLKDKILAGTEEALSATTMGQIAAQFYLRLKTAKVFDHWANDAKGVEVVDVLCTIAQADEFATVPARKHEHKAIEQITGFVGIRKYTVMPWNERKVVFLIWLFLTGAEIPLQLRTEAYTIRENARRLLGALREFTDFYQKSYRNLLRVIDSLNSGVPLISRKQKKQKIEVHWVDAPDSIPVGSPPKEFLLSISNTTLERTFSLDIFLFLNQTRILSKAISLAPEQNWSFPLSINPVKPRTVIFRCELTFRGLEREKIVEEHSIQIVVKENS
ncbi:MAG: DEAD/DEAH box helicase [Candidatus Hodarchaeota archaeon]